MLGTFTVGMAEYVVTGLLTQIASDMKVSISSLGLLISVYAVSVALIGPFMRIFTMNVRAKRLLPILVAIFIGSNVVGMLAPNFQVLLLSRLLSASMRTILWRVYECGATVAPRGKQPQAIALVQRINNCGYDWCAIRIILRWLCELESCIWRYDWFSDYYNARYVEVCTRCISKYRI